MAFDVFISYASKDKIIADAVCARLESAGIRCWIAPRDIVAGTSYGEAIIDAIHGAKVMVLVFSSHANSSGHIPKEVERAVSNGVAILPFRIEDVAPGKSLDYFIGSVHWLDAMTPPMEKHLDDLAATVHKLIPGKGDEPELHQAQTSGPWQQSGSAVPPPAAAPAGVRPAAGGQSVRPSSSKAIWIGVAAVAVLAAVVTGALLLRSGGSSQSGADVPVATNPNPSSGTSAASDPSPASKAATPSPKTTPPFSSRVLKASPDPIVGCYKWFNNVPVVIRADGTMVAGTFTARWRQVSGAPQKYTFTWPEATDTVTISPDQRSLRGGNQYGYPTSGTRVAGSAGLVGTWRWTNGSPVTVSSNGAFSAASFRGTWRAIDAQRGIYALTWPSPVDSVTLVAFDSRVSGTNQYGVAISGTKTPCAGN